MKHNRKKKRYWNHKHTTVLKLNKAYMPIDVCTWEEAVCNWFAGRASIEASYDDILLHSGYSKDSTERNVMNCPAVIRMNSDEVNQYQMVKILPLTRKSLYERDNGRCCYCGASFTISEMTVEHVYPVSRGGLSDWTNLRACCYDCNHEKGDKLLSELGWNLRKRVGVPTLSRSAPKSIVTKISGHIPHESWRQYIYWEIELEEKVRDIG